MGDIKTRPPCQFVFVEGKPGTGKIFVTKTLRNITRMLSNNINSDMASAPFGCAAGLIDGSTHCRSLSIPAGPRLHKPHTNIKNQKADHVKAMKKAMCEVIARFMDEHSQSRRPSWAWLKHRHEEYRRPTVIRDKEENVIHTETVDLKREVFNRPWGGIPFIYSFGDCAQLPPVMMTALYDDKKAKANTADMLGKIAIAEFLDPPNKRQCESTIVVMDQVLRQDNPEFLNILNGMRNGSLESKDVDIILSRCLDKLPKNDRESFKDAIHLVPQWKMAHPIVFKYLLTMKTPLAKVTAGLQSERWDGVNHCVKESSLPLRLALCVGAKFLLLSNFVVEYKIMNGSVGTVTDIVYQDKAGPRDSKSLPAYVTVYFPKSCIPEGDKLFPDKDGRFVSIPTVTEQCEKNVVL